MKCLIQRKIQKQEKCCGGWIFCLWKLLADFARVLREGTAHSKRPIPYTARAALKSRHTQNAEGKRNAEKRDSSMQSHSQQWLSLILNVLRRWIWAWWECVQVSIVETIDKWFMGVIPSFLPSLCQPRANFEI